MYKYILQKMPQECCNVHVYLIKQQKETFLAHGLNMEKFCECKGSHSKTTKPQSESWDNKQNDRQMLRLHITCPH